MQEFSFKVNQDQAGLSAKEALQARFGVSKKLLRRMRWEGRLEINGEEAPLWLMVKEGDEVYAAVDIFDPIPVLNFPLDQKPLFQNDDLVLISKKPGQVVHPCLNKDLEDLCTLISDQPLHPVNRLDRDTSGLVIIALNGHTHYALSKTHIEKIYLTIVHGRLDSDSEIIDLPIARAQDSLVERCVHPDGKSSQTRYKVLAYAPEPDLSLVECELITGRTHQIRVHMSYLGHPILGDSMYGYADRENPNFPGSTFTVSERVKSLEKLMPRQALHAYSLDFLEPRNKKRILVKDPLPADIAKILDKYEFESIDYN